ncbi:hypothetical protein BpHYR1_021628 [Brachionus plicatilis]|uniref:Uncharacterized protein n=1 Tax=Brachionus plicatilis TaxID=10195 RepID=A0A3M7P661_BRAPC|nr:hypothetical protein BpHYR1_021628 [Brachionus plicatilis]
MTKKFKKFKKCQNSKKKYIYEIYIYVYKKRLFWYTRAMAAISTSQETLNVVKKALTKHANPVPCEICGELLKNIKGILMDTFFGEFLFTFWARPLCSNLKCFFTFFFYETD